MSNPHITAKVILMSRNANTGTLLTTMECTYPRFIHAEIMTHRALSKNSASSRAIPIQKMIDAVRANPALPSRFGKANKGMQSFEEMEKWQRHNFVEDWISTSERAISFAKEWKDVAAKQIVNRVLEPFAYTTTVITGTDWENFFALRCHQDADPTLQELAWKMLHQYAGNEEQCGDEHKVHAPYTSNEDFHKSNGLLDFIDLFKISAARIARVSYTKQDQQKSHEDDLVLAEKLIQSGHMSPFEHQAIPMMKPGLSGNFQDWIQFRKSLKGEVRSLNMKEHLKNCPDWIDLGDVKPWNQNV